MLRSGTVLTRAMEPCAEGARCPRHRAARLRQLAVAQPCESRRLKLPAGAVYVFGGFLERNTELAETDLDPHANDGDHDRVDTLFRGLPDACCFDRLERRTCGGTVISKALLGELQLKSLGCGNATLASFLTNRDL